MDSFTTPLSIMIEEGVPKVLAFLLHHSQSINLFLVVADFCLVKRKQLVVVRPSFSFSDARFMP